MMGSLGALTLYLISGAILFKFSIEGRAGAGNYCQPGHFTRFANDRYASEGLAGHLGPRSYKMWYFTKWIAAVLLPVGSWVTIAAAALLTLWFIAIETRYDYKHHTLFIGLCSLYLVLSGPSGLLLKGTHPDPGTQHFLQILILVGLGQVYLSSAFIKMLSPSFRSGLVLINLFDYLAIEQYRFRVRETIIPKSLVRLRRDHPRGSASVFQTLAWITMALELSLPALMILTTTRPYAMILGALMHFGFTLILPKRLTPFTLAVLGLYAGLL